MISVILILVVAVYQQILLSTEQGFIGLLRGNQLCFWGGSVIFVPMEEGGPCVFYQPHFQMLRQTFWPVPKIPLDSTTSIFTHLKFLKAKIYRIFLLEPGFLYMGWQDSLGFFQVWDFKINSVRLHVAKSLTGFILGSITCNRVCERKQHSVTSNNVGSCWPTLLCPFPPELSANGRNNNVGSCCVRVGSGVQTYASTPNNAGTCSASWEGYNPQDFDDQFAMCNARAWPQQCWKSCANGSNIVALRFSDHGSQNFDWFQTLRNNSQQHAPTCDRVCKPTQPVWRQQCCVRLHFAWGFEIPMLWSLLNLIWLRP